MNVLSSLIVMRDWQIQAFRDWGIEEFRDLGIGEFGNLEVLRQNEKGKGSAADGPMSE